jgi:hypothetical protein
MAALPACGETTEPTGELIPFRGDWVNVADWPFDPSVVGTINIGGMLDSGNFANRGNVEVYYVDSPNIRIDMRKFTFAADAAEAEADYAKMSPWMFIGAKDIPDDIDPLNACQFQDPETGETYWQDACGVHLYYDGQTQKLRVGADIRVFIPSTWEGQLNVTTQDNMGEPENYPDRGDVTILDLPGSAEISVDSASVNVRLADNVEPVPGCTAELNQQCADAGWDTSDPAVCPCNEFGLVRVTTRGEQPIQGTVDVPAALWTLADLNITQPGLGPDSECVSTIECDSFDTGCSWLDNDDNKPFDRRAELNKPESSLEGLGYGVKIESGACATIETVEGPDDFMAPSPELRGELLVCSGCLGDMSAPS